MWAVLCHRIILFLLLTALAVDIVSELLAGLELGNLLGGDLDLLAIAGIAASAGATSYDGEGAEANQGHLVASAQSATDGSNHCIQRCSSLGLVDVGLFGDGGDKFGLVH